MRQVTGSIEEQVWFRKSMMRFMFQVAQVNISLLFICFLYCAKENFVENIESMVAT